MTNLFLILFGALMSVLGFEYGGGWPKNLGQAVGWGGTLLTCCAAVGQYRESQPYTLDFTEGDWRLSATNGDYELKIAQSIHKKSLESPTTVYKKEGGRLSEVIVEVVQTIGTRETLILAAAPFSGRLTIK